MKLYPTVIASSLITLVLFFAFQSSSVFAQTILEVPQSADLLQVTMDPENPKPFDHVTIDLVSFMTDLNKATISWSLGGTFIKKGLGEKHFEFNVGDVGETTTVNLSIQSFEGATVTRKIVVRPGNIDLIWEAFTYVPPFYEGKALYTPQADIIISALPNVTDESGVALNPKKLIYRWTLNGKFLQSDSGYGKDSLYVTGSTILRTTEIKVEAASVSGNTTAEGSISLNESSPQTVFYENNPLLGIFFEQALPNEFTLIGKEVTISAVPFFFSTANKESDVSYSWSLNGSVIPQETKSSITLRKDAEINGQASLDVESKSLSKKFQFGRNSLIINFGENSNPSATF